MIDILDLIHDATKDARSLDNHPGRELLLEEKLLYLNCLAMVINANGRIDEKKSYLHSLNNAFGLDEDCVDEYVEFAKKPEIGVVKNFFKKFKQSRYASTFLFDAHIIIMIDGEPADKEWSVLDKVGGELEVFSWTQTDISWLAESLLEKNLKDILMYLTSYFLSIDSFFHWIGYFDLDVSNLEYLEGEADLLAGVRIEQQLFNENFPSWIPIKYRAESHETKKISEITTEFVDFNFTYSMAVSFLQALLDNGCLQIEGDRIINIDDSNIVLASLDESLTYDSSTGLFKIPYHLQDEKYRSCNDMLIISFLIRYNIGHIASGIVHSDRGEILFPMANDGVYLRDEIVFTEAGFYKNLRGDSHVSFGEGVLSNLNSVTDVFFSGKIRLCR